MTKDELFLAMSSYHMRPVNGNLMGVVEECPVMLGPWGKKGIRIAFGLEQPVWKEKSAAIKEAFAGVGSAAWNNGVLIVSVRVPDGAQAYTAAVVPAVRALKKSGAFTGDMCAVCHGSGCDMAAPIHGAARPVHSRCLEGAVTAASRRAGENDIKGSYLTGLIGGILGMIVGTIPSFLVIILIQRVYALLFALIPLFAYYGYKMLGGRMNRAALLVSVVMAIVGVYFLEFALLAYALADDFGLSAAAVIRTLPIYLEDPEVWLDITKGAVMEFLFAGIGLVMVWGQISRTSASDVADARALRELAIPYNRDAGTYGETDTYGED